MPACSTDHRILDTFHALWGIYISFTSGFALLLLHVISLSFAFSWLDHSFKKSLWDMYFSLIFRILCQIWCLMESFCCVGTPGVFITPGTYHVLDTSFSLVCAENLVAVSKKEKIAWLCERKSITIWLTNRLVSCLQFLAKSIKSSHILI